MLTYQTISIANRRAAVTLSNGQTYCLTEEQYKAWVLAHNRQLPEVDQDAAPLLKVLGIAAEVPAAEVPAAEVPAAEVPATGTTQRTLNMGTISTVQGQVGEDTLHGHLNNAWGDEAGNTECAQSVAEARRAEEGAE